MITIINNIKFSPRHIYIYIYILKATVFSTFGQPISELCCNGLHNDIKLDYKREGKTKWKDLRQGVYMDAFNWII